MKSPQNIPQCHACGRIESAVGWRAIEEKVKVGEVYETLCKDCLASWTDYLIDEVRGNNRGKVA